MARFGVHSDIGLLEKVLLHRPDVELERVTSENAADLNFEDVLWGDRAREEHDALAQLLREQGVQTLFLNTLLEETLNLSDARDWLLDRRVHPRQLGTGLALDMREWLDTISSKQLCEILTGGIKLVELPFRPAGVTASLMEPDDFVLAPLPNQFFMNDSSSWIYNGVTLNPLAPQARQAEVDNVAAVYHFHPEFDESVFNIWWGLDMELRNNVALVGGNIVVAGDSTVVIATGKNTTPQALAELSRALIKGRSVKQIIAVKMPGGLNEMPFKLAFNLCREDLALVRRPLVDKFRCFSVKPGKNGGHLDVTPLNQDFLDVMRDTLGLKKLHIIDIDGIGDEDGRWSTASGFLTVKPGTVISYERNTLINARLRDHGVNVLPLPASELARCSGGPQRLACPLMRAPA
jgi:arginine deiminase